jgi:hypothetical protein
MTASATRDYGSITNRIAGRCVSLRLRGQWLHEYEEYNRDEN